MLEDWVKNTEMLGNKDPYSPAESAIFYKIPLVRFFKFKSNALIFDKLQPILSPAESVIFYEIPLGIQNI